MYLGLAIWDLINLSGGLCLEKTDSLLTAIDCFVVLHLRVGSYEISPTHIDMSASVAIMQILFR